MTDLQILSGQIGTSERTLRRAVRQGTLRAERTSARKLRMSSSEKQFVRSFWPTLAALREALRNEPNVRFALLFGSAARGEAGPRSDLDVLVEMRDSTLDRRLDLAEKLADVSGYPVDVVDLGQARENPQLLADAAAEGRVLVDREDRWPDLSQQASRFLKEAEEKRARQLASALEDLGR